MSGANASPIGRSHQVKQRNRKLAPKGSQIYLLFVASGLMIFAASPPFGLGVIAFFSLVPLLHAVRLSPSYGVAAIGGFLAGSALFFPGVFWISNVSYAAWLSLAPYCATYFAVFAMFAFAVRKSGAFYQAAALGACWILLEIVRGHMFTGFPWLLFSHTQYDFTLFTQVLDITGAYGFSGILVVLNALLYASIYRRRGPALLAVGMFAAICVYGYFRMQSVVIEPSLRVASVQASVPQEMKETLAGKYDPTGVMMRYASVTGSIPHEQNIDLIVWPETVLLFPYTLNVNPEALTSENNPEAARLAQSLLAKLARDHDANLLVGATSYLPVEYGYVHDPQLARQIPPGAWDSRYNSAYLLDRNGSYQDRYDKIHLVPFGEYIPLPNIFPFLAKLVPFTESLIAGERQTIFQVKSDARQARFGVLICYEDLDPYLARGLRQRGADFLVNISNDAWFGTSIELDQHFAVARFRAIENRVGVVRSGNNGITGIIDPLGRVTALFSKETNGVQLTKDVTGYLIGEVTTSNSFSIYSRIGDVPLGVVCVALLVHWGFVRRRRQLPS
jgi:apolipoprotein N-acyltransferase